MHARAFAPKEGTTTSYRRVCELASGGMGQVELAMREEGRFRRLYAVKRLRETYRDDPECREMFLEEARIAGLVRHPNAVSVLDVGEDERGPFLVMDYVEGTSVGQIIVRSASEPVPLQIALRIGMDAARGLHAAHELRDARGRALGLVHRDVSPQNLLVGFDGVTRVTDFGIAKALGRTTRTATGILKGKYGYLSPEQLRFEEPDRRSDIFSLGIVLFELLSGRRLYKNVEGMDGMRRILNEPPPDIGEARDDVPPELVALLFSMLSKSPDHRPPDARAVAHAIEPIVAALAEVEGHLEVSDYVKDAFATERREREDWVAREVAQATGTLAALARAELVAASEAPPRSKRGLAIGAAIAVMALLVAGGVGIWVSSSSETAEAATDETMDDGVAASAPIPPPPSEAAAAAREDEADEGASGDEPSVEPSEPTPSPRRRARRSGRARTMRSASTDPQGVPMWEWQE